MTQTINKIADESKYIKNFIANIIEQCPRRQSASADERKAQQIVAEEFKKFGLDVAVEPFLFNDHLYKNLALHFGVGLLGTIATWFAPVIGLSLHLLAGISLFCDSTRKGYILRRLFRFKPSANVVATMPGTDEPGADEPDLRIVVNAHIDAAFTGYVFKPDVIKKSSAPKPSWVPNIFDQPMRLLVYSLFYLALFDLAAMIGAAPAFLKFLSVVFSVPIFIGLLANLEVIIRNEVVPGANDDLSGVAALMVLASRLPGKIRKDVELVFVSTGCEEASVGGAHFLAETRKGVWDPTRTFFLSLDSITGGDLKFLPSEGDVIPIDIDSRLKSLIEITAASNEKFSKVEPHAIPLGGTDNVAFMARGWKGAGFVCIDPEIGAPRHYHLSSDTVENLDVDGVIDSIDFIERLIINL